MARKVNVRKSMPKGMSEDTDLLNDMFSQMTGTENADTEILIPKFCKLHGLLSKYSRIYQMLLKFNDFTDKFQENKTNFDEISEFIKKLDALVEENNVYLTSLQTSSIEEVNVVYKKLKASKKTFFLMGNQFWLPGDCQC